MAQGIPKFPSLLGFANAALSDPAASHSPEGAIAQPELDAGMAALQSFYDPSTGLWKGGKWWNSANALETVAAYSQITKSERYLNDISNTFDRQKDSKFISPWFNDDDGWWALAWIKAYDLTGEQQYLEMAKSIFATMSQNWDNTCGGGIWWTKQRKYKNAIANSLFLSVAVKLHLRTPNDQGTGSYGDWAMRTWNWFQQSGMINGDHLINDGLNDNCRNNGDVTWTYNQGVMIGAMVDLAEMTGDPTLIQQAERIADATIRTLAPNGILREPCEPSDCGIDGVQFKGIFIRNLADLYRVTQKSDYQSFIQRNAASIWTKNRNAANQFGLLWQGPIDQTDAVRQSSALDALNAAVQVNRSKPNP